MKINTRLAKYLEARKNDNSYWIEQLKLDFSMELEKRRLNSDLSYTDIANKLGTSVAYVSKVFRGESNLTIESMVKLAETTKGKICINVVDANISVSPVAWFCTTAGFPRAGNTSIAESGSTEVGENIERIAA